MIPKHVASKKEHAHTKVIIVLGGILWALFGLYGLATGDWAACVAAAVFGIFTFSMAFMHLAGPRE